MESATLPDIPNSIYNGNGFDIASDAVHNQGNNGICTPRKKIVIVGLGMVALSFMYVSPLRSAAKRRTSHFETR